MAEAENSPFQPINDVIEALGVDKWGRESFSWRNKMDGATKEIEVTAIDLAERFVGISEVTWTAFNPQILAMLTA